MSKKQPIDPSLWKVSGPPETPTELINKYGRCKISFDCAPQSFLKTGENPILMEQIGVVHNPTKKVSLPIIKLIGYGNGGVIIGSKKVEIKSIGGTLYLDCETEHAYTFFDGAMTNENKNIYAKYFPRLDLGDNSVTWYGGIQKVEIIPRWWET